MAEVLVLVEHSEGALKKVTAELITAARALGEPSAVVVGAAGTAAALVDGLKAAGAAKIYVAESDDVEKFLVTPKVDVLAALVESGRPGRACCVAANADGKEIAGRLAARIGSGLLVDVVEVKEGPVGVHSHLRWRVHRRRQGQRRHPGDHGAPGCHRGRAGRRCRRAGHRRGARAGRERHQDHLPRARRSAATVPS